MDLTCTVIKEPRRIERVTVALKNTSAQTMNEVKAILAATAPGIKVVSEACDYATLRVGAEASAAHEIEVGEDAKAGIYEFTLNATYRDDGGKAQSLSCKVPHEIGRAERSHAGDGDDMP